MPTFITRLELVSGKSLSVGSKWFKEDGCPIGLIIDRPEELSKLDEQTTEKTAAQYEIWLLPENLCAALFQYYRDISAFVSKQSQIKPDPQRLLNEMQAAKNVVCRRVFASMVVFTEEIVVIKEAHSIIHDFFVEKIEEDEATPDAPALGAPNGPDAR
jgi:hypothetical protein